MTPKASILIADDDADVLRVLARGATDLGYEVSTASDGGAAIDLLQARRFDVVILDLQMTPVSGWEVVEFLRDSPAQEARPILLSGHVDVPLAVSAMKAGVFDVLQKPVRMAELSARLEDALLAKKYDRDELSPLSGGGAASPSRVVSGQSSLQRLLGGSAQINHVREQVRLLARFRDVFALIVGETGTGKELVASAIHELSAAACPFVSINCAAIPEESFERELFGHEAGVLAGAPSARPGLLEAAADGTLFLDEIGEMPLTLQPKVLRVLQTRSFRRVGDTREREFRARVVSTTSHPIGTGEQSGVRSDLYFRLAGFTIQLPPLRERLGDLEALATCFLGEFAARYPGLPTRFDDAALRHLLGYDWPGNVRELRAVVERAAISSSSGSIDEAAIAAALPRRDAQGVSATSPADGPVDLNELQRQITIEAFERHQGNLARAARHLSIPRSTLRDRLRRYGILQSR